MLGKTPVFYSTEDHDVMPDAAPGGAAGVWPGRFSVVLWKRNANRGVRMQIPRMSPPASLVRRCFLLVSIYCWPGPRFASKSLRWRFVPFIKGQRCQTVFNLASPDARHSLFKVSPPDDTLLITLAQRQSAAAKAVLEEHCPMAASLRSRTITVRLCGDPVADNSHRFG